MEKSFAKVLRLSLNLAITLLLLTFILYLLKILKPYIPFNKLRESWHLSYGEFSRLFNYPKGFNWLKYLKYGDIINFLGIYLLALTPPLSYFFLLFKALKEGEKLFSLLVLLQLLIFILIVIV